MPALKRVRQYCFTLNNYVDDDLSRIRGLITESTYGIVGKEIGDSGTPHLQGYIVFPKKTTFEVAKQLLGSRCHLEPSRGTPEEASEYCRKDGDYFEHGILPRPGQRNDLESVVERCRKGSGIREVAETFGATYIRYHRGIERFIDILAAEPTRTEKTEVRVYVGKPSVGKSLRARTEGLAFGAIYYKPHGQWWDGYSGQPVVIMDDFYGGYPYHELLNLLDRYPLRVPYKGGFANFTSKLLFLTSNRYVSQWYNKDKFDDLSALFRRLDLYEEILPTGTIQPWALGGFDHTTTSYDTTIKY